MKITDKEQFQTKFLLGRSLFLGGGISLLLSTGEKDVYLGIILGFLLGIPLIYLYTKVSFYNIKEYLKKKTFLNYLVKGILLIFYLALIFYLVIIFAIFIYSFYLPFTKTLLSCTPFLFLAIYLSSKGNKAILRIIKILFFINVLLIIFKYGMLSIHIDLSNFLPIYTIGSKSLFKTALIFMVFTTSSYMLVIDAKTSFKTNLISYLGSSLIILIMNIYLIGVFGSSLARTFSYPEFSILRQINVFNFIQNIESFLAINWLFDIFIALSLSAKNIKEILGYQHNTWTYIIFLGIAYLISTYVIGDYKIAVSIYKLALPIFLILNILTYLILLLKKILSKN